MISMNKAFFLRVEDRDPKWRLIDAKGETVGRLASKIADALRGKDRASYTPHTDSGDYIVVVNADQIEFSGNKMNAKIYRYHTGWRSGLRETVAKDLMEKKPSQILHLAVKGMLPKNKMGKAVLRKLKIYAGENHPHAAQIS